MKPFLEPVFFAFGIVAGLSLALVLLFLWAALAGPIQERILELTLDRYHRAKQGRVGQPEANDDGPISILISDVHIDTWDYADGRRPAAFSEFLNWVKKEPRITDLYINGDILDVPPHPLNQPDLPTLTDSPRNAVRYPDLLKTEFETSGLGVLGDQVEPILQMVGGLLARDDDTPPLSVTYLTGNHDIGIEGLRYVRPKLLWSSFRVVWNPAVAVKIASDRWLYVEHGHRYDPFLWIYLRYAALELFRRPATAIAQRNGHIGMNHHVAGPTAVDETNASHEWEAQGGDLHPLKDEGIATQLARYRFRQAARRLFRELKIDRSEIKVVTFGHTHIPDRYEFPHGRIYINSGDWAGNSPHQCFLVLHPSGHVSGPHQWRGVEKAEETLRTGGEPVAV